MKLSIGILLLVACSTAFAQEGAAPQNTALASKSEGVKDMTLITQIPSPWKFNFSGWAQIESESFVNFGDGVATNFDHNDAFARQQDSKTQIYYQTYNLMHKKIT